MMIWRYDDGDRHYQIIPFHICPVKQLILYRYIWTKSSVSWTSIWWHNESFIAMIDSSCHHIAVQQCIDDTMKWYKMMNWKFYTTQNSDFDSEVRFVCYCKKKYVFFFFQKEQFVKPCFLVLLHYWGKLWRCRIYICLVAKSATTMDTCTVS